MVRFGIKCRAKRTRLGDRQQGNAGGEGVIKTSTLKETLISKFGLSNAQADDILAENKEDYILDKIKIIGESRAFKAGQIKNIAAYLISAIKKDYQLPKDKLTNIVTIDNARAEIEIGDMKRVVKKIHSQYQAYREGVIDEIIEALPD